MKILHYTLGLPPMRSGGLTKYATELMSEQVHQAEHEVYHLYPGMIDILNRKTRIKAIENSQYKQIKHYEIVNSLPLPLFGGVANPDDFVKSGDKEIYLQFLQSIQPDVIHLHTLMGLHKEFIEVSKELGVRIVFTTHDYYGICPKITLFDGENHCEDYREGSKCATCCKGATSTRQLKLLQTSIYPQIKKMKKILIRRNNNITYNLEKAEIISEQQVENKQKDKYAQLRKYYIDIHGMIDYYHFNSNQSKNVYQAYLPNINGDVIHLSYSDFELKNVIKTDHHRKRIGYLGPRNIQKGFFDLLEVAQTLPQDEYELHAYGDDVYFEVPENIFLHGKYQKKDLSIIFQNIDLLVVPSRCKETFGFVTLEAIEHQTPVFVSEHVGSKDLLGVQNCYNTKEELIKKLTEYISKTTYRIEMIHFSKHIKEIEVIYKKNEKK